MDSVLYSTPAVVGVLAPGQAGRLGPGGEAVERQRLADAQLAVDAPRAVPVVGPRQVARSPTRPTNIAPMLERFGSSRLTRAAVKLFAGCQSRSSSVWMFSSPTLTPPALPLRRAPPRIGTSDPVVADADAPAEEQIDVARPCRRRTTRRSRERTAAFPGTPD